MTERKAQYWIDKLKLTKHPEGGFYRLTYTADVKIPAEALPRGFKGARVASTAIYFLLSNEDGREDAGCFSAFHRLQADELWHFHAGGPLVVHSIAPDGSYGRLLLGPDAEQGEHFQGFIPAGCWFASEPLHPESFALVSCTVAPGFDFEDFEMGKRAELSVAYPQHRELVARLTRD